MNSIEYAQLLNVLRESGSFNDAEPLYASVRRLVDERDSERARANRLRTELSKSGEATEAAIERIRRLEQEIIRLSTPPGSAVGYSPRVNLPPLRPPAPPPAQPPALAPDDRSRMGRQRRELRRLNAIQRSLRLEAERSQRLFEDAARELLDARRLLALLGAAAK